MPKRSTSLMAASSTRSTLPTEATRRASSKGTPALFFRARAETLDQDPALRFVRFLEVALE
jgi:hypothetical protein